jgi:ATP-dependent RNA helicase DHX57
MSLLGHSGFSAELIAKKTNVYLLMATKPNKCKKGILKAGKTATLVQTKIAIICNLGYWGRFFKNIILPASANKTSTMLRSTFAGSQMLSNLASQWFLAIGGRTFDHAECGLVCVVVLGILAKEAPGQILWNFARFYSKSPRFHISRGKRLARDGGERGGTPGPPCIAFLYLTGAPSRGRRREEGGRRKEEEEGGRRKEEGRRRKEEGRRRKEEGGRRKEEGGGREEEEGGHDFSFLLALFSLSFCFP